MESWLPAGFDLTINPAAAGSVGAVASLLGDHFIHLLSEALRKIG